MSAFESLYSGEANKRPVALDVADWARDHPDLRIALCGHVGDYDLQGGTRSSGRARGHHTGA
jgi:hypothetical protein